PRFVSECPGVLLNGAVRYPRLHADGMPSLAGVQRSPQLFPVFVAEFGPPQDRPLCARSFETGFRPLTDLLALDLGERCEHSEQDVADEFVVRRQVLFGVAMEADAMRVQPLKVA